MKQLASVQNDFQRYLFAGESAIYDCVLSTTAVPADVRLNIYRHAYQARLIEALEGNFSCLYAYVGTETFEAIAGDYIAKHPSTFRSIRWYGDGFAAYLMQQAPWSQTPYLAELAQLEWQMAAVFDAADAEEVTIEAMSHIPPEKWVDLRLHGHPSLRRVDFHWNTFAVWQALSEDQEPPEAEKQETVTAWIMWRKDLINHYQSLTIMEAWAVDAMLTEATFGELCAGLCQWVPEAEAGMQAATLLRQWIQLGWIASVSY